MTALISTITACFSAKAAHFCQHLPRPNACLLQLKAANKFFQIKSLHPVFADALRSNVFGHLEGGNPVIRDRDGVHAVFFVFFQH